MLGLFAGLVFAVLGSVAPPAHAADGRLGLAILAWVHSIDATPVWSATMSGLTLDEVKGTAGIGRLTLTAEAGGLAVEVEGIRLEGLALPDAGGFEATQLQVDSIAVRTTAVDIEVGNVRIDGLGVPALAAVRYLRFKPFTSLLPALAALAGSKADRARLGEVAIVERFENVSSRISYRNVAMGRLAAGKIESLLAGPILLDSPSPNPLVELNVANASAKSLDLNAFLDVYDPLRYIAGVGDKRWRTAAAEVAYTDISMTAPGVGLKIARAGLDNFSLRQPAEAFAPLLDASMADMNPPAAVQEAMNARYLAGLASAYGVGRFSLEDVAIAASGIDQLTLDRFVLSGASSDRIGEIAIEGFTGAVPGQGAVTVGRLAVADAVMTPVDELFAAFDRAGRGFDVDISALAPRIGSFEATGLEAQAIDFPGASLETLRADFDDYVGTVPTNIAVTMTGLDLAASSLWPDRARSLVASLGYDRISADAGFGLTWDEANGEVKLEDFRLDIRDFGLTTAEIVLAGLTREAIETSKGARMLADMAFDKASVTFEDRSVVDRSLSMRADLLKIPLERLKQQMAGALPLMLAVLGNPEMVRSIAPVLQTFIKTPGTLTIEATPSEPVALTTIESAARSRPQSLPGLLSIKVSGTPGPGGDASGTPPMRESLEPAPRPGTTGSTTPSPAEPP